MNPETLERLSDNALDIAEDLVESYANDRIGDILEDHDIELSEEQKSDLISRLHSAVVEEIYKYCKDNI